MVGGAAGKVPRKNLSEDERRALIDDLLKDSTDCKSVTGDLERCAGVFGCSVDTSSEKTLASQR